MLTPFCIFLDVSTVKNNSTIWQFGDSCSFEQSYSRKLIISKSRIALTPLKTLFTGSTFQSFIQIKIWCQSRGLSQLHKLLFLALRNQRFCQLRTWWQNNDFNQTDSLRYSEYHTWLNCHLMYFFDLQANPIGLNIYQTATNIISGYTSYCAIKIRRIFIKGLHLITFTSPIFNRF